MICKRCGKEIENNTKFCMFCGEKVENENNTPKKENISVTKICPHCGKDVRPKSKFCNYCGKKLTGDIENTENTENKKPEKETNNKNTQTDNRFNPENFSWNNQPELNTEEIPLPEQESVQSIIQNNTKNNTESFSYTDEQNTNTQELFKENYENSVEEEISQTENGGNKKVMVLCIVSMVVCIACVIAMIFIFGNRNKNSAPANVESTSSQSLQNSEEIRESPASTAQTESSQTQQTTTAQTTAPTTTQPPATTTAPKTTTKKPVTTAPETKKSAAKKTAKKSAKIYSVKELYGMSKGTVRKKIGNDFKAVYNYTERYGTISGITSTKYFPDVVLYFENQPNTENKEEIKSYFTDSSYDDDYVQAIYVTGNGYLGTLNGVKSYCGMTYKQLLLSIDSLSGAYEASNSDGVCDGVINGLGIHNEYVELRFTATEKLAEFFSNQSEEVCHNLYGDVENTKCRYIGIYRSNDDKTENAEQLTVCETDDTVKLYNAPDEENGAVMCNLQPGETVLTDTTVTDDNGDVWCHVCEYDTKSFGVKQGYIKGEYLE